jgi:hypothetical protein
MLAGRGSQDSDPTGGPRAEAQHKLGRFFESIFEYFAGHRFIADRVMQA